MLIRHIGFRVRGFYTAASLSIKDERMSHSAREKHDTLIFREKHGLNATLDYAGVSRPARRRRLPSIPRRARLATLPHLPEMPENERPRRTLQPHRAGRFVDYHEDLLFDDPRTFNHRLLDYPQRDNSERPHLALNCLTPCHTITENNPDLSRMWWHQTID